MSKKPWRSPHGLGHRPSADIQVKSVLQQRLELDAQQPAFGQQPAVPLDEVAEVLFQGILGDDHRLTKERARLSAPQIEYVTQPGQIGQGYIGSGQAIDQPGPVHKQGQMVLGSATLRMSSSSATE